jgi:hypothetical protein
MAASLEKEFEFFMDNQESLTSEHNGKVLVLHDRSVVGVFDDKLSAYLDAKERFAPGTFMIQECIPGPEAYTLGISTLGVIGDAR